MNPADEARKAALEAAYARENMLPGGCPDPRAAINAYESRLNAMGYVLVPRVATPRMIEVGYEAMVANGDYTPPEEGDWIPRLNAEVWSAMITASHPSHDEGS